MNCQVLVQPFGPGSTYERQCKKPAYLFTELSNSKEMVGWCGQHAAMNAGRAMIVTVRGSRRYLPKRPTPIAVKDQPSVREEG